MTIPEVLSSCPACEAAVTNRYAALYHDGCVLCQVRAVSHQPKELRELFIARIEDAEEKEAFRQAVVLEYHRRLML